MSRLQWLQLDDPLWKPCGTPQVAKTVTWGPESLQWILASAVALGAACFDVRFRRIPKWVPLYGGLSGLMLHSLTWGAHKDLQHGALASLLGAAVCSLPALLLWYTRVWRSHQIGGGDVRLLAALGAILGFQMGIRLALVAGTLLAVAMLVCVAWRGSSFAKAETWSLSLPFAPFAAAAVGISTGLVLWL